VIPGGTSRSTLFVRPEAPVVSRGAGAWVTDEHGSRILDCNNNYTALVHGHGFEPVRRAVAEALDDGASFGLPTCCEIELAEHLRDRAGHERWRFCNSGTEAVMQAVRCARAVTGRDVLVRFAGSYHGTSDAVTDQSRPGIPRGAADDVVVLPQADLRSLRRLFEVRGEEIAAVLIDLMPNRAGLLPADHDYVHTLRDISRRHGALMIVDEVITFRLASGGLCSTYGVQPDLVTLGKVIGGGLPIGALAGRTDIMTAFDVASRPRITWGGTFSANPLSMSAGLAALTAYDDAVIRQLNRRGDELRLRLTRAGLKVNGSGSLLRIMEPVDADRLWWATYQRGVLIGTNGLLALSTCMDRGAIDIAAEAVITAIRASTSPT
jgi:glutamate-1-semialdehyde 2,1-aminomutase